MSGQEEMLEYALFDLTSFVQPVLATPSITLISSASPVFMTYAVSFQASLNAYADTPAGTVTFYDGSTEIGTATLSTARPRSPPPRFPPDRSPLPRSTPAMPTICREPATRSLKTCRTLRSPSRAQARSSGGEPGRLYAGDYAAGRSHAAGRCKPQRKRSSAGHHGNLLSGHRYRRLRHNHRYAHHRSAGQSG